MRNNKIHLILTIFSLTVFFTIALMFTGCSLDKQLWDAREETEAKAAEKEVKEEQKEQIRALQENEEQSEVEQAPTEETDTTTEERSFPSEPVTYTGDIVSGIITMTLIVNFKTTEVTGSCPSAVEKYGDWIITDGKLDLDTLKITAIFSGVSEMDYEGNVIETSTFTLTGEISGDLSMINGEIPGDEGENVEIILTR